MIALTKQNLTNPIKTCFILINMMIKKNKNHKSLLLINSWGFTTYVERYKYKNNGIVLKVIKKGDKLRQNYSYPHGPGVVIQTQSTGAWIGASTLKFIQEEYPNHIDRLSERDRDEFISSGLKKEYVFFIELCLRMNNSFIQNDLIYMKYY